jgi:membrane protease YdiL (CAAX protease family)
MHGTGSQANNAMWFLVAALACVSLLTIVVGAADVPTPWLRYGVLTPAILALIFVSFRDREGQDRFFSQFVLTWKGLVWCAVSVAVFPALAWTATLIGNVLFQNQGSIGHAPGVNTVLVVCFLSLGEEVGWRGYALPRLVERFGWTVASLLVGLAWWLWHMPGWMLGFGAPSDISFLIFGLWVISASFLFSYLYRKSCGSVWTSVLLHASANLSFQVFPIMPAAAGGPENFYLLCALSVIGAVATIFAFSRFRVPS